MAKRVTSGDPTLSIEFFVSGFYTYRSQLFAPFKGIGVNVVSFHDPVLDGVNFELTDKFEWQRRPGFSIFCTQPLQDSEVVRAFYFSRNLNGVVTDFADTSARLLSFTTSNLTTILTKTTTAQGYVQTVGNRTFFADGKGADLSVWDGRILASWGLAAPTTVPTLTGLGFWQADTSFTIGQSTLDPNGNIEAVTAVLVPNGAFESPTAAGELANGGSLAVDWAADATDGGYSVSQGYRHIQSAVAAAPHNSVSVILPQSVAVGDVVVVVFGVSSPNLSPTLDSVTDNLGNTYTVQATSLGSVTTGGTVIYKAVWVASAPVTVGGACTVTANATINNTSGFYALAHEFSGISATPSAEGTNYSNNTFPLFNTGAVGFSGTQLVFSAIEATIDTGEQFFHPDGYVLGATTGSTETLQDAFVGRDTSASPLWHVPAVNQAAGLSVSFPINSLATGFTPYLYYYSFNCAIPTGAIITGIQVNLPKFNASGVGQVKDQSVKLVIGGAVSGSNRALTSAWSNAGYTNSPYGGPNDLWGLTPTAAQLNANGLSGFGLAVSANFADISSGSLIPVVGFNAPHAPTVTVYYRTSDGGGGLGLSGPNEPVWATTLNGSVNDGGLSWTNYGPVLTWQPSTGYPLPAVVLDNNGNLQLTTNNANPIATWSSGATYATGNVVYFGGGYWISLHDANTDITPSADYADTSGNKNVPYWAPTSTPLVTGTIPPVWNTTPGGATVDGAYTWTNIGQGGSIAIVGYGYVYAYRTLYGHLTTASPFSQNTGAILGPVNAAVTAYQITSNVVTFTGNNNFLAGNIFQVQGMSIGTFLNNQTFTVISATPSEVFPLTSVEVNSNKLIVQAVNNLAVGQVVTFSGVGAASFLNGISFTVIATGLSSSQFEANLTHTNYGPTTDTGTVSVTGSYTAAFTHANVGLTQDSGSARPLVTTVFGHGTGSSLCNAVANISAVQVAGNIVTVYATNFFREGIWVTLAGLTGATFLNTQQVQVIAVEKPLGTQSAWFQVFYETPNYSKTSDVGTATFNAVEIYRLSDGGGQYLFTGAVTNPGNNAPWTFNDFTLDDDLDVLLVAALGHQNDPPPGAPGSTVQNAGTIMAYWQNRIFIAVDNFVYFDAGPDCVNGLSQESFPPSNRFQFSGPVLGLEPTADGVGLLVYLADRVNVILGGPETITFYPTDFLSNFGIANTNAKFRDGSTIGQFTTQKQYIELVGRSKDDVGDHIADYLAANFKSEKSYVAMHRCGLDVGVWVGNGTDRLVRFGVNPHAWSVPYFPLFGAGAMQSVETSVGLYSLLLATPAGGKTGGVGPSNPSLGQNIVADGVAWTSPENITEVFTTEYATVVMDGVAQTSQILRSSDYLNLNIPHTAAVQGIQVTLIGHQNDTLATSVTITPTNGGAGATKHTFQFGATDSTVLLGGANDTWGMPTWRQPYLVNDQQTLSFDIRVEQTVPLAATVAVGKVQVTVIYQNPGNYIYARDLNSWGDCGVMDENTGTPYAEANIVLGNIQLRPLGASAIALGYVVGYFDAVGSLNDGGSSLPDVWILPNEVAPGTEVNFIQLPEVLPEPPTGQNKPSSTIQALRFPVNMMNSNTASQWIHHLQVKLQFEPENAPNTIKAIAFKEGTDD